MGAAQELRCAGSKSVRVFWCLLRPFPTIFNRLTEISLFQDISQHNGMFTWIDWTINPTKVQLKLNITIVEHYKLMLQSRSMIRAQLKFIDFRYFSNDIKSFILWKNNTWIIRPDLIIFVSTEDFIAKFWMKKLVHPSNIRFFQLSYNNAPD